MGRGHIRSRNREFVNNLKRVPCTDCKVSYPPYVMDFDHLGDKKLSINRLVQKGYSIESILEELKKCEVVCSNCHRTRTKNRK